MRSVFSSKFIDNNNILNNRLYNTINKQNQLLCNKLINNNNINIYNNKNKNTTLL